MKPCLLSRFGIVLCLAFSIASCNKEHSNPPVTIYMAGANFNVPTYWVNGKASTSNVMPASASSAVSAMSGSKFVAGADVYVAGDTTLNGFRTACYWKNGKLVTLTSNQASEALAIYVSGPNVYVAGYYLNEGLYIAAIWKNGALTTLATVFSQANAIFVSGSDVYVAGTMGNSAYHETATLWKNGAPTLLPATVPFSEGYALFVLDNDVYVGGECWIIRATRWLRIGRMGWPRNLARRIVLWMLFM